MANKELSVSIVKNRGVRADLASGNCFLSANHIECAIGYFQPIANVGSIKSDLNILGGSPKSAFNKLLGSIEEAWLELFIVTLGKLLVRLIKLKAQRSIQKEHAGITIVIITSRGIVIKSTITKEITKVVLIIKVFRMKVGSIYRIKIQVIKGSL